MSLKRILPTALMGVLIAAVACGAPVNSFAGEVVIANPGLGIDSIDGDTLKKVYLGRTTKLDDGSHVNFAVLESGPTHEGFLKKYVSKSPSQFLRFWRKITFSGKGTMPEVLSDDEAMVAFVEATEGAIGYVSDATDLEDVSVLEVSE